MSRSGRSRDRSGANRHSFPAMGAPAPRRLWRIAACVFLLTLACWGSGSYPPLERERIGYANHTSYFPIDAGAVHNRPDCELCHGGTATFADFSCIRCHDHARAHTDSTHASVAGYAYDSTSCYICHPNGTVVGVNHDPFFPIGSGTKHDLTCLDCHQDAHDHLSFTCLSCHRHSQAHTDSTHVRVTGYHYASPACLACHPRADVMSRDQHASFFPIATGAHAQVSCGDCHQIPGNYLSFTCISCHDHAQAHTDSTHTGVAGYAYDSPSCRTCHPQGVSVTRDQHTFFPIVTGAHATNPCTDCHTNLADYRIFSCISCHDHDQQTMDPAHVGVPGYTFDSPSCRTCHPQGTFMTRAQHATFFPIDAGAHANTTCGGCHEVPFDFTSFTCISCHDHAQGHTDSTHVGVPGYVYDSPSCRTCHPQGVSVTRDQHAFFPIVTGAHATNPCTDCHTNLADYRIFTCISCHDHDQQTMDPAHVGVPGYTFDSPSCLTCHPQGTAMTRAQHDPFFPIATGTTHGLACGDCHTTPRDYSKFECILCHTHDCSLMDPAHIQVGGYSCVSSECYRCHPRGVSGG